MSHNNILLIAFILLVGFVFTTEQSKVSSDLSLGDRLLHTFFSKTRIPLNVSEAMYDRDWASPIEGGRCIPGLGYGFVKDRVVVYYTSAGQLSGFGVRIHGSPKQARYWFQTAQNEYQLDIGTRDPSFACSGFTDRVGGVLGDRLILAPSGVHRLEIPRTEALAIQNKWTPGGCISGMGTHYGYNLLNAPAMAKSAQSLLPVVPMYSEGKISAVLFFVHQFQKCWPLGQWEGPFVKPLFCKNFCSDQCMENESTMSIFSTMHFLFRDTKNIKCSVRCH